MRNVMRLTGLAFSALIVIALPACGDDDGNTSTGGDSATTETTATANGSATTESDTTDSGDPSADGGFPSEEFCAAVSDFESAQDGAQRNQALGDMAEAAGADMPPAISQALENLDTGDLPAEAYAAAEQALTAVCN